MRNNLKFSCYSGDHIFWIIVIALPMLAVWVLGIPLFGLAVLIKDRNQLDESQVRRYLLVVYQGLRKDRFYWEFINTSRKFVLLCVNSILFVVRDEYRLLVGLSKCI